ncbi:hypothetical protein BGZ65_000683, partial [Modicella reniformis]
MASIENNAGDALVAAWKKTPSTKLTWSKSASNFLVEGGGAPSYFSSYGLDGELRSKPDIAAPGGNILSTLPTNHPGESPYGVKSGTSMATPYIAGSYALYMQAKGIKSRDVNMQPNKPRSDDIRQVLKNTAKRSSNINSKTLASVAKQGAGLVNVLNAIETTTSITPDHIDLLDSDHFHKTVKISIKNNGRHTETYT